MPIEKLGRDVRMLAVRSPRATVRPPGSKSLTNRHLLCAALADGESVLRGASPSDDSQRMIVGLAALGVRVQAPDEQTLRVEGCRGHLPETEATLDAGDAGTAMRFLTALCCVGHGDYKIDGSPRMRERPIGALVDGLSAIGASIGYGAAIGYPPLTIAARGLGGGEVGFEKLLSSQFLTAILLVAPYASRDVFITVEGGVTSRPYVDMTIRAMHTVGVDVLGDDDRARMIVPAYQRYRAGPVEIEPDASGAGYFWAAAAVTGGRIAVEGLTRESCQGDAAFVDVLEQMGCTIECDDQSIAVQGPTVGDLRGIDVDLNEMPDTVQTLASVALFAQGATTIRNVANLRVKETDRLAALERELTKCGARVQTTADSIRIEPPRVVLPAEIETYNDHRMAMSFGVAGLAASGIIIRDAGCVSKSFPTFFEMIDEIR